MATRVTNPRMHESLHFQVLSEKTLPQPANPNLITYCPSMDLVAIATTDQQVLIYRLNGQRVYGATQKGGSLRVESIRWKPNGQLLAIAWSDGSVRLISAETSKVVHQFATEVQPGQVSGVTCMRWATNLMNKTSSSMSFGKTFNSWEDLTEDDTLFPLDRAPLDLPRDLALIDIETALPKLSTLPSAGGSEDVFSSKSSLDTLFRPFDPKDNEAVDVMVVGTREGSIHLSIYDSFVIGSFLSPVKIQSSPSYLILHASNQQYSTHSLLVKSEDSDRMYFATMDLPFISTSSKYLSLLASRSTALQDLLRYINQAQVSMTSEWKSTQDLPGKFLRNINETLQNEGNRNIVQALYHSVASGHTFPEVKEWLVDELSERGHKRWDKAVTAGLENLRRLVHENFLPALQRCSLILSRFSGIAKFQGSNDTVGFSSEQINFLEETVACLHLLSSKILARVVDELDLFAAFSAWLRYEIDRLASDSPPSPSDEAIEKEALIDHSKVLLYIQTAMTTTPLAAYLGELPVDDNKQPDYSRLRMPSFDVLHEQLKKQEQGLPHIPSLLRVEPLCTFLSCQANAIFAQIAEAERSNVSFGKPEDIGTPELDSPRDMRMCGEDKSTCRTHIAFVPKNSPNSVQIVQLRLLIMQSRSTLHGSSVAIIQLGDGRIQDIKFWDDDILLILWESNGKLALLSLPYGEKKQNAATSNDFNIVYTPTMPKARLSNPTIIHKETIDRFPKFEFPQDNSFVPTKIEVRERSHPKEREDSRRIVLLAKDRLHYKVFSIKNEVYARVLDEDVEME